MEDCRFNNFEFRVENPNSASIRFKVTRLIDNKAEKRNWRFLLDSGVPGLVLSVLFTFSIFWALVYIGIWLLLRSFRNHTEQISEEMIEVFHGVAIQLTTRFSNGSLRQRLIPISDVGQVVLNEACVGFYIRTYLAILPKKTGSKSILPFEHTELPLWLSSKLLFSLRRAIALV